MSRSEPQVERCNYCRRPVVWRYGPKGGLVPLDAEPAEDGTVAVQGQRCGTVTRGQAEGMRRQGQELYRHHRFTCPQADEWSKRSDREARFRKRR